MAPLELIFETGAGARATRLTFITPDRDTVLYEPVTAAPLTTAEASTLGGTYYSDELDATYMVTLRDGDCRHSDR